MIPTHRSVIARLRYRSLDGGWSEDSLCKATKIRLLPRNAAMEKKIFFVGRKSSSPFTTPVNSAEQDCSRDVFWFSSSVILLSSAISVWLQDKMTNCKFAPFSCIYFFSYILICLSTILLIERLMLFCLLIPTAFTMINTRGQIQQYRF